MKSKTKSYPNFLPSVLDFAKTLKIAKKTKFCKTFGLRKIAEKLFEKRFLFLKYLAHSSHNM